MRPGDRVRVPWSNRLARVTRVSPNGKRARVTFPGPSRAREKTYDARALTIIRTEDA
jgi:hypothetical protein